jgi:hypothetical protein
MSVHTISQLLAHENPNSVKTMLWVMSQIDYSKLASRIKQARDNPTDTVKCVLLQYAYTSRYNSNTNGYENIVDYMPNSSVLVQHALHTPDFIRLMDDVFAGNNPRVKIYARQKVSPDGTINVHKKQLVVMFEPYAFSSSE